jgi:hypothetical protein
MLDPSVQARLLDGLSRVSEPAPRQPGRPPDGLTLERRTCSNSSPGPVECRVSEATVKTHINHAFGKAGVRDRAQAVAYAYRTGLARP